MPTQTKKIAFDTAALFFGKVVGLLVGMIRLKYLAEYLDVDGFGILNFALYFCSLFQVLFEFGIAQFLIRELSRDLSKSNELVGTAVLLKVMLVFIASSIVGGLGFMSNFNRVTNWAILLTTLTFAVNGISTVFLSAFQAHRKMKFVSVLNFLNDVIASVAIILIIQESPYVVTALLIMLGTSVINLAIVYGSYVRLLGMPKFHLDVPLWKIVLRESTPIAISSLGISTYTFIGPTVLKYAGGDVEVGIYSAGYKLISILGLIPLTISQVVYPIFSEFFANAKEKLDKALSDSLQIISMISIPLATGVIFLAPAVFALLYPEEYKQGTIVFQLTIVANIFGYMDWVLYAFLLSINRQRFAMVVSLSLGIAVAVLSMILVPIYGFKVLPYLSIVSEGSLFFVQYVYLRRANYKVVSKKLMNPLFAAVVMGIFLFFFKQMNLVLLTFLGLSLYLGTLYLIGGFGAQERELVSMLARKLSFGKSMTKE